MSNLKIRSSFQITEAVWFALLIREFQAISGRRRLGFFWAVAEPLIHLLTLSLVLGLIRGRHDVMGYPYPVLLVVGLAPFLAYRRIMTEVSGGVASARPLFAYKQITPMDVFFVRALVALLVSSGVYLLIVGAFSWYGWDMSIRQPLQWMVCIIFGVMLSFALGLLLGALVNAIPDIAVVVRMAFLPLYIISGVIVPASRLPPQILEYLMWNPFLHISELTRFYALENFQTVPGISMTYVASVTSILLFCGLGMYRVIRVKLVAVKG